MNRNKKIIIVLFTVVFVILLVACGNSSDEQSAVISDEPETNNEKEDSLDIDTEVDKEEDNAADQTTTNKNEKDKKPSETKENIKITSGEDAAEHLKQQLEEGKNEDISFGGTDTVDTDEKGSYYTVQLVDIPLRASGKTGNLGYYKVYQDGTYEIYQVDSSVRHSEIAKNIKEEYLHELNDTEKEIDKLRKNSEAITTRDMENEEEEIYITWDAKLNEIYGILEEQLSKGQMDKLREEQRKWIEHRDETAKKASQKYEDASMEQLEYKATQATLTKERCYELVENYMG
jgi:uncharacterized protein YecT (DUF1311 family)/outer membrane murein-binding lipoprotein Lpp